MNRSNVFESFFKVSSSGFISRMRIKFRRKRTEIRSSMFNSKWKKCSPCVRIGLHLIVYCEWWILQQCLAPSFETNILSERPDCLNIWNCCFFTTVKWLTRSILVQQGFLRKHGVRINCAHYSPNLIPRISKVEIEYEGSARGTNRSPVLKQLYYHNEIVLECSRSKCVYESVHLFQTLYWIRRKLRRILISNVSIISLLGLDLSL